MDFITTTTVFISTRTRFGKVYGVLTSVAIEYSITLKYNVGIELGITVRSRTAALLNCKCI